MLYAKNDLDRRESDLITEAAAGGLEAFNQLVIRYQDIVYRQAFNILGERESAEDMTQDSFIRAYQAVRNFRGGSFRAWLLRIVTNACYDELRRRKNHRWLPLFPENNDGDEIDSPAWLIDPDANVEDSYDCQESSDHIRSILINLPNKYRNVVELIDVLDVEYAEAALVLDILSAQ